MCANAVSIHVYVKLVMSLVGLRPQALRADLSPLLLVLGLASRTRDEAFTAAE